jgi:circadian clock protein KaiC
LRRVLAVVKVRGSAHSDELREFEITDQGIIIGRPVRDYEGLLAGHPRQFLAAAASDQVTQR